MMKIEFSSLVEAVSRRLTLSGEPPDGIDMTGRVLHISASLLKVRLPGVFMGELCQILPGCTLAEVVAVDGEDALLSPFVPAL